MKRLLIAVLLTNLASCKKKETAPAQAPVKAVVTGLEMIDYQEPSGAFEVVGPADWKVREDDQLGPSVMFLGPGTSKYPRSVSISVSRYPNQVDKSPDPKKYYAGMELIESHKLVMPYTKRVIGAREVECYAFESPFRRLHERKIAYQKREDTVIIPFAGGFYSISHDAPVDIYKETLPVFEAVVASFKPGKGG